MIHEHSETILPLNKEVKEAKQESHAAAKETPDAQQLARKIVVE